MGVLRACKRHYAANPRPTARLLVGYWGLITAQTLVLLITRTFSKIDQELLSTACCRTIIISSVSRNYKNARLFSCCSIFTAFCCCSILSAADTVKVNAVVNLNEGDTNHYYHRPQHLWRDSTIVVPVRSSMVQSAAISSHGRHCMTQSTFVASMIFLRSLLQFWPLYRSYTSLH